MHTTDAPLATFTDRFTLVYDRWYPHEIDLVFEAVSTPEHLEVWMLPGVRIDRRLGGSCAFGWGSPADDPAASTGHVTVFEPPTAIEYTFEDGESHMRFDLAPDGAGTRLHFTLHFLPGQFTDDGDYPGADRPAGGDTPWRPGFVGGYHGMLDDLLPYLAGEFTAEDRAASIAAHPDERDVELIEAYREHIRTTCPPA